ncbi:hypothetical protein GCM10022226_62120 [Sphaerisporangium flaviroseum]|uniref:Uncharacterized protein n=1 Tax=Sphaerisporangium flaviroseum TaxID=509199 RepID=A0ABP7J2V4_9ACTN
MAYSAARLELESAFERYLLDAVAPAAAPSSGVQIVDYRELERTTPRIHAVVGAAPVRATWSIGGASTSVDITPLVFGAAWKILDLVVDAIVGTLQNGDPLPISSKHRQALVGNGPARPKPFGNNPELWKRYMRLYANAMDLRHSVVHRELIVRPSGDLEATASRNQAAPPTVMSVQELNFFFRAVQGFYSALISEKLITRERDHLCYLVNRLQGHHGLGQLPEREITRDVLILAKPVALPSGSFEFDARPLLAEAYTRWPTGAVNVMIFMPDGAVLGGPLEDAPADQPASIRSDYRSKWLQVLPEEVWRPWARFGQS